jgi:hypothetical protein
MGWSSFRRADSVPSLCDRARVGQFRTGPFARSLVSRSKDTFRLTLHFRVLTPHPLPSFNIPGEFIPTVFQEIVTCMLNVLFQMRHADPLMIGHYWLCVEAKILHRDISIGNIMWYQRGEETLGCLIDLDLATIVDETGERIKRATPGERTGTTTFPVL